MKTSLVWFLVSLLCVTPIGRADEQSDRLKKALQAELLKALLEDDDDEDKPKKPKNEPPAAATPAAKAPAAKAAASTSQSPAPAPEAEFGFEPFGEIGKDIYPSVAISLATIEDDGTEDDPADATVYGDKTSIIGVLLRNVRKGDRIVVEISADAGFKPSRLSFVAKESEKLVVGCPKIKYDFDLLARNRQSRPINVTFKVTRNDKALDEVDQTWTLRQVNDCPLGAFAAQPKKNGTVVREPIPEMKYIFAAYVNENHPWVDSVLKDAKATRLCSSFNGYQGTEKDVLEQVNAIWTALQRKGITYSSITATTGAKQVMAQHVRFLDESISSTQANCVDGSVLLASILKKIEIEVYLVLVPGHCYLAFSLDEQGTKLVAVETTMIGNQAGLADAIQQASNNATNGLFPNLKRFQSDQPGWMLISVSEARKFGIMPLPYTK